MVKYTIKKNIKPIQKVWAGYTDRYITAPDKPGLYNLYEYADDNNQHIRFEFEKEV